ncbi:MAG: hypothetical protein RL839_00450 [Gammaproteobacteria bacterium]
MTLEKLNSWLTLLANLGVIAGIVFLAIEINQNSKAVTAQTRTDISQSVIQIMEVQRNPGVIEAMRKRRSGEELSFEDNYYLENLARTTLRTWENTYYQYQNGLFDDEEFGADYRVWRNSIRATYMRTHWENARLNYSPSFRAAIDELVD